MSIKTAARGSSRADLDIDCSMGGAVEMDLVSTGAWMEQSRRIGSRLQP